MSHSFYISEKDIRDNTVCIKGSEASHISKVLRLSVGDNILCKTYERKQYTCQIASIEHEKIFANIISKENVISINKLKTGLFLSVPKSKVINSLIPKCTELGVDFIQPIITERSFLSDPKKINIERWQKLSLESMKQCGRNNIMNIKKPMHLDSLLNKKDEFDKEYFKFKKIFPWENAETKIDKNKKGNFLFFIGPEGGITHSEAEKIKELGFNPTKLTENILKVETAVIYTLIKYGSI